MKVRGGEFSTGTMGNFQPELTKNSLPGFLGQQTLQPMDLLLIRRFMRVRPRCLFSWLEAIEFGLSLRPCPSSGHFFVQPQLSTRQVPQTK
jgi:hypothetical protein